LAIVKHIIEAHKEKNIRGEAEFRIFFAKQEISRERQF
jgi:hypothetical protein